LRLNIFQKPTSLSAESPGFAELSWLHHATTSRNTEIVLSEMRISRLLSRRTDHITQFQKDCWGRDATRQRYPLMNNIVDVLSPQKYQEPGHRTCLLRLSFIECILQMRM
jgi:hypothetical protein